ncbi:MAG: DUF1549 domain-containing protein [Akkermansiaceae bacterium]|nr:DUF1549 domain-containing protein [Akkermansiaceae bacterium]
MENTSCYLLVGVLPYANAFAKVVDRLLASPHYGERWGRHWLDMVRYSDSDGGGRTMPLPDAWRFRDYVIDSFQQDKPLDRMIREHIAGDLLPAKTDAERAKLQIATGFLALGAKGLNEMTKAQFEADVVDEQGNSHALITTPNVAAVVREHFACADLPGAETENTGGTGSGGAGTSLSAHWDARIYRVSRRSPSISVHAVVDLLAR